MEEEIAHAFPEVDFDASLRLGGAHRSVVSVDGDGPAAPEGAGSGRYRRHPHPERQRCGVRIGNNRCGI